MEFTELFITIFAVYAPTRFIVQDASLKNIKQKYVEYTLKTQGNIQKVLQLGYNLIMWPYWTVLIVLPLIYFLPIETKNYLAVIGAIYFIYDTIHD